MAIKFSFILPCYNVEKYIGRCLDSILNQDIPHSEYEIICVNDCSPDNLSNVVRQYQQRYPNIVLIEHTENKTAGGARNTGIEHAKGEYIWFVDPDDQIMPNSLKSLWNNVREDKADILFFNHNLHTYEGKCIDYKVVPNSELLSGQDFFTKYFPNQITKICSVCDELMHTEYVVNSKIRFPEIAASQDVVFLWELICNASCVKSIDSIHYSVYRRINSTTGKLGRISARTCFSFSVLYPIALLKVLQRNNIYGSIRDDINQSIRVTVNDNSKIVFSMPYHELVKMYRCLQEYKNELCALHFYMNTLTRRLLRTYNSMIMWLIVVRMFSIRYKIKNYFRTFYSTKPKFCISQPEVSK